MVCLRYLRPLQSCRCFISKGTSDPILHGHILFLHSSWKSLSHSLKFMDWCSYNLLCNWIWSKRWKVNKNIELLYWKLAKGIFCDLTGITSQSTSCRLFKKYLLLILINQMESALLRFTAAAGRNIIIANTLGTFALFARFALGGFIISRGMKSILL